MAIEKSGKCIEDEWKGVHFSMQKDVKLLVESFAKDRKQKKQYVLTLLICAVMVSLLVAWGFKLTGISATADDTEMAEALEAAAMMDETQETEATEIAETETEEDSEKLVTAQTKQEKTVKASKLAVQTSDDAETESVYRFYFAAPSGWENYVIRVNVKLQSDKDSWRYYEMKDVGSIGNTHVYCASIPKDECIYNGYATLQFQKCNNLNDTSIMEQKVAFDSTWTSIDSLVNKIYRDTGSGYAWHSYGLAGKTIYFSTASFSHETSFSFLVDGVEVIPKYNKTKKVWYYKFPDDTSATIQTSLQVKIGDKTYAAFQWNDTSNNLVVVNSNGKAGVTGTYEAPAVTVYFDATLSKLSYALPNNTIDTGSNIPKNSGNGMPASTAEVLYCYVTSADGVTKKTTIQMKKEASHTDTNHTWSDVWSADIPAGYTRIRFATWNVTDENAAANGDGTAMYTIPEDLDKPCFYADTSDSVIYTGGNRGGYWDEVYTIRDAQTGKNSKVNNISSGTFTKDSQTLYVDSTIYDYFSDYELNGTSRSNYDKSSNGESQRNWVTFRQFDQALSSYYQSADASYPIYTGHFQPSYSNWGTLFSDIAGTLNLYHKFNSDNKFFAINNSTLNDYGKGTYYNYATQGLVAPTLENNNTLLMVSNSNAQPHFNTSFLEGDNSKNTKIGEVYDDVAFPFTKKEVYEDENGVEYWWFDSANTSLTLKKNSSDSSYYLDGKVGQQNNQSYNVNSSSKIGDVSNTYGYFPLNFNATEKTASTYNYGFGTKMSFKFRLTSDGTVKNSVGDDVPIRFRFSGDDDVWVFIDGKLVLDCGGAHGKVTGLLDFKDKKAYVSDVKEAGDSTLRYTKLGSSLNLTYTAGGEEGSTSQSETYNYSKAFSDVIATGDTKEHTLTMFYMERGMWESNMSVAFNFPDENQLQVQKKVDTSNVADEFKSMFDNQSIFSFTLKNMVTHYGTITISDDSATPETFASAFTGTISPASSANTFKVTQKDSETVLLWNAKYSNEGQKYTDKRLGILQADGDKIIDASEMRFLKFGIYYDGSDTPSQSLAYLVLTDENGKKAYGFLNNKLYGSAVITKKAWATLTVDLDKLKKEDGFDWSKVNSIGFQYDKSQNIYLKNFVFYPSSVATKQAGFIVKQKEIADYGSAESGQLELAKGAKYTSTANEGTYVVDENGEFALQNEELIRFRDQFRRGSYLQLTENLTETQKNLFDTSWTMYENEQAVASSMPSSSVFTVKGTNQSLIDIKRTAVDDGRTEVQRQEGTEDTGNKYTGTRPDDSFVFRSYSNPDSTSTFNKQKIVFTNVVKTGSLTISKKQAEGSETLGGKYTFYVVCTNVGGMGLESSPVVLGPYNLKIGESKKISGIPINTDYKIYEIKPEDNSKLQKVEIDGSKSEIAAGTITITGNEQDGFYVEGSVSGDHTAIMYNSRIPLMSINVTKKWVGDNGERPNMVVLQLQRRSESDSGDESKWEAVPGYSEITLESTDNPKTEGETTTWSTTISDLEVYVSGSNGTRYQYRLVELDEDENVIAKRGTFGKEYSVTYDDPLTPEEQLGTESKTYNLTVQNKLREYELPETGGTGTQPFGVAGAGLMVLSLIALLHHLQYQGKRKGVYRCTTSNGKRGKER